VGSPWPPSLSSRLGLRVAALGDRGEKKKKKKKRKKKFFPPAPGPGEKKPCGGGAPVGQGVAGVAGGRRCRAAAEEDTAPLLHDGEGKVSKAALERPTGKGVWGTERDVERPRPFLSCRILGEQLHAHGPVHRFQPRFTTSAPECPRVRSVAVGS